MIATDCFLQGKEAQAKGNFGEAVTCFERALEANVASLGEFHPDVAFIKNSLGTVWFKKGGHDQAIEYLEDALKILCRICTPNHPMLAEAYRNLGMVWSQYGDSEKAIQLYEKAMLIYQKNGMTDRVPELEGKIESLFVTLGKSADHDPIKIQSITKTKIK